MVTETDSSLGINFIFVHETKVSVVTEVISGGLAEKVGMKPGDVLLDNEGTALSWEQLVNMMKSMSRPFSLSFAKMPSTDEKEEVVVKSGDDAKSEEKAAEDIVLKSGDDAVDKMPHQVRGLVYALDPQSVNEKSYTEQEEGGLTSPHASAAEKEMTAEDVTAAVKRLTTVQPNNKKNIASRTDEDTRTHFFKCPSNTTGFPSEKDCNDIRKMLEKVQNWDGLTGGTIKGKKTQNVQDEF